MPQSPEILDYQDYRAFLRAQFDKARTKNRRWSLGAWARKLELGSTSSLTKVLDGSRRPGREMSERFKKYFGFNSQEARYFDFLVQRERGEKDSALHKLVSDGIARAQKKGPVRLLSKSEFNVISSWYTFAIRELLKVDASLTPDQMVARFRFPITASQVRESLAALTRVGLIERKGKQLRVVDKNIDTEHTGADEARRRHHEATLDQTKQALATVPVEDRHVTNISFVLRKDDREAAREAIEQFREDFISRFSGDGEEVYRLQLQLLPLTQAQTEKAPQ